MQTKTCTKCKVEKPIEGFARNTKAKDGLQTHCKVCMAKANKDRRDKANTDKVAAAARESRKAYMKAYNEKYRKENHAHKLDLTHQWRVRQAGGQVIEEVDRSVVLERADGICQAEECDRVITLKTMHLDHITPVSRGGEHSYVNTQALCGPCNILKGGA